MAYQQNDNSGSLFRNEKKNTPAQPDYEGSATINGTYLRIAAWIKTSKSGTKYMSLAFNEPQPNQQQPRYGNNASQGQQYAPQPQYNPRGMQQTGQVPPTPLTPDNEDIPF